MTSKEEIAQLRSEISRLSLIDLRKTRVIHDQIKQIEALEESLKCRTKYK